MTNEEYAIMLIEMGLAYAVYLDEDVLERLTE